MPARVHLHVFWFFFRAIGEKLFANSGKKRYNEFEVKKDVKH